MQFVDLDVVAALRAARSCRAAAADVRRVAARIDPGPLRRIWEGTHARAGERDLWTTCEALHAEARALEATAEAIEQGVVHARRVDERLAAEHAARRARHREQPQAGRLAARPTAGGAWS